MSLLQKLFAALMMLLLLIGIVMIKLYDSWQLAALGVVVLGISWVVHALLPKARDEHNQRKP